MGPIPFLLISPKACIQGQTSPRCRLFSTYRLLPFFLSQLLLKQSQDPASHSRSNHHCQKIPRRIPDRRQNEDPAVRRSEGTPKGHRQPACRSRSRSTGRNDPKRVGRRKRNGPLGNKRQSHDKVDDP